MLTVEVVSRADLSRVIERRLIDNPPTTLMDLVREECPAFSEDVTPYLSAFVDAVKYPYDIWKHADISRAKTVKIVIEAGGLEAGAIIAIISIVMSVASAVYAIISMNRMSAKAQAETKQGSSIYDVNAQGNQVNLNNTIPENFGYFKRYPDYLADRHVFYRNNRQFVDMILCQGVGQYARAGDNSDVFVGETPISELDGCQLAIYEPGQEMTPQNSIEDRSWYCFYSSTQVTQSGHTLKGTRKEVDQSSQTNAQAFYDSNTFIGTYSVWANRGAYGCAGPSDPIYVTKKLDLNWETGAYFTISGNNNTRAVASIDSDTLEVDADDPTITHITADLTDAFKSNLALHEIWLRPHRVEVEEDETETEIAGDLIRVLIEKSTTVTYTRQGGTEGPHVFSDTATSQIVSLCEVLAVEYDPAQDSTVIILDVPTAEVDAGTYPAAPTVPSGAYNVSTTQGITIDILQPMPADYPYSDNGLYRIDSHDSATGVYTVSRINQSYGVITDWLEFWAQGVPQTGLSFTLDDASADLAGESAGPYRACPVGATSSIFEYDIVFPQGLGYLQDNGTFRNLTVQLEIAWRRAGSSDAWQTITRTFTEATNDELGYTFQLEVDPPDNYEFKIKNLSEEIDSTRALQEVRWTGLKSVISTKNKYDNVTVIIGRFRGSETLSELSSNQISTYWTRKLPDIHNPANIAATRELAPAIKYICNNSKYAGIIDSNSLDVFASYWEACGIKFDGTIDSVSTLLDVLRDALNVGFSAPVIRNNKLAFVRLHEQEEGEPLAQVFSPQNMTKSPQITFNLPREDETAEIVTEYTSPDTYKTETIFCSLDEDGNKVITSYPNSDKQEKLKAFGVTRAEQAEAMGMRRLRYIKNTRVTYTIETELDGLNCQYNDLVGLFLDENLSNITGRLTAADGTTIYTDMEIPVELNAGIVYIRQKNGQSVGHVYSRISAHQLEIDAPIIWDPQYGASIEPPFFAIGEMVKCWVTDIIPNDKKCTIKLINYNADIFTDDIKPEETE